MSGGVISFTRLSDGAPLTALAALSLAPVAWPVYGNWSSYSVIAANFTAAADERIFGLGEHPTGALDMKGVRVDFADCTTYDYSFGDCIVIPFYTSSRGYGLLWNLPSFGKPARNCS